MALQEVVLEIRFPPIEDYAIFAGAMSVSHKVNFPLTQKLEPPGLPEFVPISGIVQEAIVMFTTKWQERSMSLSYEDSKLWKEILASQSEQGFPDF